MPKIAKSPTIHPTAQIRDAVIGDFVEIHEAVSVRDASVGDYSYLQEYVGVLNARLGRFCAIAAMGRIGAPNHPYTRVTQHRFSYVPEYYWESQTRDAGFFALRSADACTLGHDVWMGHGAIVLPGVSVGDGAVIAAGAVVTKDVAPYTIVGGIPATPIKPRFPAPLAARLQALAWWHWSHDKLEATVGDFQMLAIEAFLEKHGG